MYNNHQLNKISSNNILHKVGKRWQVVSIALLIALGGTAVANHANADVTPAKNNSDPVINSATNQVPSNLTRVQTNGLQNSEASSSVSESQNGYDFSYSASVSASYSASCSASYSLSASASYSASVSASYSMSYQDSYANSVNNSYRNSYDAAYSRDHNLIHSDAYDANYVMSIANQDMNEFTGIAFASNVSESNVLHSEASAINQMSAAISSVGSTTMLNYHQKVAGILQNEAQINSSMANIIRSAQEDASDPAAESLFNEQSIINQNEAMIINDQIQINYAHMHPTASGVLFAKSEADLANRSEYLIDNIVYSTFASASYSASFSASYSASCSASYSLSASVSYSASYSASVSTSYSASYSASVSASYERSFFHF